MPTTTPRTASRRGGAHPARVRPFRPRSPSCGCGALPAGAVRLRPDPHTQGLVVGAACGPAGRHTGHLHHPRIAVLRGERPAGQRARLVFRAMVLHWATRVLVQSREDRGSCPSGICRATQASYVGNGIVMDRFVEPVHRRDPVRAAPWCHGQPAGAREGMRDFLALAACPGRKADFVHVGPSSTTRAMRSRRPRSPRPPIGARDLRRGRSTTSVPTWPRPTWWSSRPTARVSRGSPWRPRPWADRSWPTTSGACARSSIPALGLLAPRGDLGAHQVVELVADPERRADSARAATRVVDRFSEDHVVERLRTNYDLVAGHWRRVSTYRPCV